MRPDHSTALVVALFKEWQTGLYPRGLVQIGLKHRGTPLPIRTMDRALARAVADGNLAKITSHDGCGFYGLESFVREHPEAVEWIRQEPMRSLNSRSEERAKYAADQFRKLHFVQAGDRRAVDLQIATLSPKKRRLVLPPGSMLHYPVRYKGANTCRECGARFLSSKARRNHEARAHKARATQSREVPLR